MYFLTLVSGRQKATQPDCDMTSNSWVLSVSQGDPTQLMSERSILIVNEP